MTQLFDHSLLAVYEADGNIVCVKSTDLGVTWSAPITIARYSEGVAMAVPDILELNDHSPFAIAANKSGLWNSLAVLSDNTIIALTSTNSYSKGNTEIWMIKGHVLPE